jgi:hypothetical protein
VIPVLCCAALAGCFTAGPTARSFPPALGPQGAFVDVYLLPDSGTPPAIGCELLAVQDSALVLACRGRVTLAPWGSIRRAAVPQLGHAFGFEGGLPPLATRERLRAVSRFPQGMRNEWIAAWLTVAGQPSPDVLSDGPGRPR